MTVPVRDATADDIPGAALMLAAAFAEYPWTRWSIPAADYAARLEELQGIYLRHALRCGIVLVDYARRGVAALLPPDAPEPAAADRTRIAELMGERLDVLRSVELPQRPATSWDLAVVGVHPDSWGRGIASAILAEGLRRLDARRATTSVETSDARNVALYARHGFAPTATTRIPDGPSVHAMLREPANP